MPHDPQLSLSIVVSVQLPCAEQYVSSSGHPHFPFVHAWSPGHAFPQVPQSYVLVSVLTQEPSQQLVSRPQAFPQ